MSASPSQPASTQLPDDACVRIVSNGITAFSTVLVDGKVLPVRRAEWSLDAADSMARVVLYMDVVDVDLGALPAETIVMLCDEFPES